jgi:CubicO group peptidase (beta-lactamase class C family)
MTKSLLRSRLCPLLVAAALCGTISACSEDSTAPEQSSTFVWPTAAPTEYGFAVTALDSLTERIEADEFGEISSLLIVMDGHLIYEEYFLDMAVDRVHDIYSVTKSVTAALIGMAVDEGLIDSLEVPLLDFFSEYEGLPTVGEDLHPRDSITLEDALQMRAGFDWDEFAYPYSAPQNPYRQMRNSDDMFESALDHRVVAEPGSRFNYNTGVSTLLSRVIQRSTGMNARDWAATRLFGPLDIGVFGWERGPGNVHHTGTGIELRPRDMAKIGWLFAQGGVWQGQRILSSEWIERCWQPNDTQPGSPRRYGYHWWLMATSDPGGEETFIPFAEGYGGQFIVIAPFMDMVIVSTAEEFRGWPPTISFDGIINEIGRAYRP